MIGLLLTLWGSVPPLSHGVREEPLVDAAPIVPGLLVDLRYATRDNFLKAAVYPKEARCLLRRSVAERLSRVAVALAPKRLRLKVFDCYRPLSVQWKMWKLVPKPGYVANPRFGSPHNRGAAVDLTLADASGQELEMPTPFDTFSPAAHHSYSGASEDSRLHRALLKDFMEQAGFKPNPMEWWHYEAPNPRQYRVLDEPFATRKIPAPLRRTQDQSS